ncbi:MAG: hypothetical protein QOK05_2017 [Chloroflexota bacterium]|jgi:hypothetical protein|nr:hypothetical protein [Chloroflexota bacterium]
MKVQLREIAFARSGDKGDVCSIGVVPYRESDIDTLRAQLTVECVRDLFGPLVKGEIRRYEFHGIRALNFVMDQAIGGGVSRSLNLDVHGKNYAMLMLSVGIDVDADWIPIHTQATEVALWR